MKIRSFSVLTNLINYTIYNDALRSEKTIPKRLNKFKRNEFFHKINIQKIVTNLDRTVVKSRRL